MGDGRQWVAGAAVAVFAICVVAGLSGGGLASARSEMRAGQTAGGKEAGRREIEAFNKKYIAAHLQMDNAAVLSMWAAGAGDAAGFAKQGENDWVLTTKIGGTPVSVILVGKAEG